MFTARCIQSLLALSCTAICIAPVQAHDLGTGDLVLTPRWTWRDEGPAQLKGSALPPDASPMWFYDLRSHTMAPLARGDHAHERDLDQGPAFVGLQIDF